MKAMFDSTRHKLILIQILKEIYSQVSLGPILGFKGGTATHLFYNLPRFSVDLDFDLLESKKEKVVFGEIEKILNEFGQLKEKTNKRNTLFYLLAYEAGARNVKVEISKRNFGSEYELLNFLGIPMLVMKKDDIFAHKLAALLERKKPANRDIFDVWYFLKQNWELDEEILKKRTGLPLKKYLSECVEYLEKVSQRRILAGMGDLMDEKTKNWARKSLISDTIFLLRFRMGG